MLRWKKTHWADEFSTVAFGGMLEIIYKCRSWNEKNQIHIQRVMGAAILFPVDQVMCDWLNHTTWFHSNRYIHSAAQRHGIWANIASFLYTIQMPICYVGCLLLANTWNTPGILLSWKTKNQFVFFLINLWTLVTFTFKLCKLRKMFTQSQ